MEVLVCLAQNRGEPILKETLLKAVWPDTFVTDDVLTRSISELRRAFEDDARESTVIQTIPKRGYRLLAPVTFVNETIADADPRVEIWHPHRNRGDAKTINSLVVLPFTNASGDPDAEYLSEGITEAIINHLSQLSKLRVVPRNTAFRYKKREADAASLGEFEQALDSLEKVYQERSLSLACFAKCDPRLDPLRVNPRFDNLLRLIGVGTEQSNPT
jgi:hypothetical protein